jgi:hypothetical protein
MPDIKIGPVRSLVSRIGAQIMGRPRGKKPLRPGPGVSLQSVATPERSSSRPIEIERHLDSLVKRLVHNEQFGTKRSDRAALVEAILQMIDHDLGQALSQADEKQLRTAARAAIKGYEPDQLRTICDLLIALHGMSKRTSPELHKHRKLILQPLFAACMARLSPDARPLPRRTREQEAERAKLAEIDELVARLASNAPSTAPSAPHTPSVPALPIDQDSKPLMQVSWQKTPSPRAAAADPVDSVTRQSVADLAAGLVDAISNRRFNQALQRLFDLDQLGGIPYREIAVAISQSISDRRVSDRNIGRFIGLIDQLIMFMNTSGRRFDGADSVSHMLSTWSSLKRSVLQFRNVKTRKPSDDEVNMAKQMVERLVPADPRARSAPVHDLSRRRIFAGITKSRQKKLAATPTQVPVRDDSKPGEPKLVFRSPSETIRPTSG